MSHYSRRRGKGAKKEGRSRPVEGEVALNAFFKRGRENVYANHSKGRKLQLLAPKRNKGRGPGKRQGCLLGQGRPGSAEEPLNE